MSKIKLLLDVVEDMRSLADSLQAVADAMCAGDAPTETPTEAPAPKKEPKKPAVTKEQVREILGKKSGEKGSDAVRALLQKYGANKLSAIDPKDYASLMADAEVL